MSHAQRPRWSADAGGGAKAGKSMTEDADGWDVKHSHWMDPLTADCDEDWKGVASHCI